MVFLPLQHCHCVWIFLIATFSLAGKLSTKAQILMSPARHLIDTHTQGYIPYCLPRARCDLTFHLHTLMPACLELDVTSPFIYIPYACLELDVTSPFIYITYACLELDVTSPFIHIPCACLELDETSLSSTYPMPA